MDEWPAISWTSLRGTPLATIQAIQYDGILDIADLVPLEEYKIVTKIN